MATPGGGAGCGPGGPRSERNRFRSSPAGCASLRGKGVVGGESLASGRSAAELGPGATGSGGDAGARKSRSVRYTIRKSCALRGRGTWTATFSPANPESPPGGRGPIEDAARIPRAERSEALPKPEPSGARGNPVESRREPAPFFTRGIRPRGAEASDHPSFPRGFRGDDSGQLRFEVATRGCPPRSTRDAPGIGGSCSPPE